MPEISVGFDSFKGGTQLGGSAVFGGGGGGGGSGVGQNRRVCLSSYKNETEWLQRRRRRSGLPWVRHSLQTTARPLSLITIFKDLIQAEPIIIIMMDSSIALACLRPHPMEKGRDTPTRGVGARSLIVGKSVMGATVTPTAKAQEEAEGSPIGIQTGTA